MPMELFMTSWRRLKKLPSTRNSLSTASDTSRGCFTWRIRVLATSLGWCIPDVFAYFFPAFGKDKSMRRHPALSISSRFTNALAAPMMRTSRSERLRALRIQSSSRRTQAAICAGSMSPYRCLLVCRCWRLLVVNGGEKIKTRHE